MHFGELLLIAVGLSMDAFAVSVCKGLASNRVGWKQFLIAGAWFGGFQALMPLLGYFLGYAFEKYINAFDHWIAFVLLGIIGANMIKDSFSKEEESVSSNYGARTMFVMAVATSIDALAVGVTFALLPDVNILIAISLIGLITFALSALGIKIGNVFGVRYKSKAEFSGGLILVLMGLKILLEHLGIL
ncbi:MAG: manganese efflux pump [Clostridia bacterium]|nr:manganese efflux pump [Clostridia bacterium]